MSLELTPADRNSALWQKIHIHLTDRLESLRRQNDNDLDERKTARVRGRIAEAKLMLDWQTQKQPGASED